jgi:hypothetical protein
MHESIDYDEFGIDEITPIQHSLVQIVKCFFFQTVISPIQHSLVQVVKCFFFQTVISPIQHSLVQIVKMLAFFKQLFHQYRTRHNQCFRA